MTVPHCLQRRFNMTQFWGPDLLLAVQRRAASYNDLRLMIEDTVHATVHLTIGGDFAQLTSTNDPIFYPHHAMIDKIWYDWQFMGNGDERFSDYNGVDTVRTNVNVQLSDPIPESSLYRVRDVMHPRRGHLCYTYAESRARKAASALLDRYDSGDPPKSINQTIEIIATALGYDPTLIDLRVLSGNETNIKGRESNPEWWNVMNNLKADEVNLLYGNAQAILKELSSLPYYVSPSAVQLAYIKSHSPQNPPYEIWEADMNLMSTGTNNNNVSVSIITAPPTGFIIIENLAMSSPALDSHASIENKDGGIFVKVPQPTFQ
ncbi:hypothetical protein EV182_006720 [Spiromyces aspiralis]|uniref:Uncharacterized protein n=1 Tax=Spiromyces aspiralis TaxID=68401 RepID=A0ACC1HMD0_9FUNG|nr:hypothetical protein EV182_006720 [Spiromyces aspiralis]